MSSTPSGMFFQIMTTSTKNVFLVSKIHFQKDSLLEVVYVGILVFSGFKIWGST